MTLFHVLKPKFSSGVSGLVWFGFGFGLVFLVTLHGFRDLSSLTRNWARGPGNESTES